MRWRGRRRSTNVEDRRARGPVSPGLAVGGGLGLVIMIVVLLLMGWKSVVSARNGVPRGLAVMFVIWSLSYMVHAAMRLALRYREAFHKDVVIDLECYRRLGHNEADEPAATQPIMYQTIRRHPTTRTLYGDALVSRGVLQQHRNAVRRAAFLEVDAIARAAGGQVHVASLRLFEDRRSRDVA